MIDPHLRGAVVHGLFVGQSTRDAVDADVDVAAVLRVVRLVLMRSRQRGPYTSVSDVLLCAVAAIGVKPTPSATTAASETPIALFMEAPLHSRKQQGRCRRRMRVSEAERAHLFTEATDVRELHMLVAANEIW